MRPLVLESYGETLDGFHFGVGIRYYFWRNVFARPEAHYYIIPNNVEFHSDNVFRVGASIGHTFGTK